MNTNTPTMNAVNKVQTPNQGNKTNTDKKGPDLQFEALFSSALGQIAPNAQLNSIESQLRESLFKQDKPKKDTDHNANAEAAQAAVWAQRNWMQQASAPAPQAATQSVSNMGNSSLQKPQATEEPAKAESANTQNTNATAKESEAPAKQSSPDTAAKPTEDTTTAQATVPATGNNPQASAPQQASTTVLPGDNELTSPMGSGTDFANPTANTNATNPQNPAQVNLTTTGTPVVLTTEAPGQTRDTGNAQIDAVLNAGTISKAGDPVTAAPPTGITTSSNANAVAAQLAPQIAQQTQGMDAELEVGELKAGQKILAASNLQAAGNPNATAAGTNGLTGPSGTAQQTLIKTPVNQPGFAKELGQTVQWAIGKNMSTVDIRVNPESFGPMNMRLIQKGQQVQIVIRTQDEASANLLTQSLSNLKEVLAQNGLQLNQVQIQHGNTPSAGQGQQNQSQAQFDQNSGQQGRGGQHSAPGGMATDEQVPTATQASGSKPSGQLDMFA